MSFELLKLNYAEKMVLTIVYNYYWWCYIAGQSVNYSSKPNIAPQQTQNYDRYRFLHVPKSYTKINVESVHEFLH